jgi:orotidine-5'-phosphate decarboxylase
VSLDTSRAAALDRLRARVARLGVPLALGIDPVPTALPDGLSRDVQGIETFARGLVEAVSDRVVAIKVNLAFFEAFGSAGWTALERLRADVPADQFFVADAKRGDIGTSAERYADGILGHLAADAVTLSPYLGSDAIEPFLAFPDSVVYVLTRTSNPSGSQLQDLSVGDEPLHLRVARWVAERWPEPRVGLVAGATAPDELRQLRNVVRGPAFLVPGVGAQGGDLSAAAETCHGTMAPGMVPISRAIASASSGSDWKEAAAAAASAFAERMRGLM